MPLDERKRRWQALIEGVRRDDVHQWRAKYIDALAGRAASTSASPPEERPLIIAPTNAGE